MDETTLKELANLAKQLVKSLQYNEDIRIEVTSDNLVHVGSAPIFIKVWKEKRK